MLAPKGKHSRFQAEQSYAPCQPSTSNLLSSLVKPWVGLESYDYEFMNMIMIMIMIIIVIFIFLFLINGNDNENHNSNK